MALVMTLEQDSNASGADKQSGQHTHQQDPASGSSAGGIFLALGCIVGAVIGGFLGQPSLGFLIGLAAGALAATGTWLFNR